MDVNTWSTMDIAAALRGLTPLYGRTPISVPYDEITDENIRDVLSIAYPIFEKNRKECNTLYEYYRGKQPIIYRTKSERPEICNKVVVNRAYEIVTFKTGRFLYKDILYTNRTEGSVEEVDALNRAMYAEGKAGKDRELVDWFHITGFGYRLVTVDQGAPFHIYTVSPDRGFVVYADTVERQPLLGCYVTPKMNADGTTTDILTAYSKNTVYTVNTESWSFTKEPHALGDVPLVEYPANQARLGCFEVVLSLLNAINNAQSNRLDGVEQFIQAFLIFKNLNMSEQDIADFRKEGAICLPEGTDLDYLTQELSQSQVQTLVDDLYQSVLTICGMPNRNGGSSTSDNKGAVVLRDGWSAAATAVKETKQYFEASERRMLSMVLRAFNLKRDAENPSRVPLTIDDIDIHFDEGEYENTLEKAQVLQMLLGNAWVHPKYAYLFSNITSDPEAAYLAGKEFHEAMATEEENELLGDEVAKTFVHGHWRREQGRE